MAAHAGPVVKLKSYTMLGDLHISISQLLVLWGAYGLYSLADVTLFFIANPGDTRSVDGCTCWTCCEGNLHCVCDLHICLYYCY